MGGKDVCFTIIIFINSSRRAAWQCSKRRKKNLGSLSRASAKKKKQMYLSAHMQACATLQSAQYRIVRFAHFGDYPSSHIKHFDVMRAGAATSCWR